MNDPNKFPCQDPFSLNMQGQNLNKGYDCGLKSLDQSEEQNSINSDTYNNRCDFFIYKNSSHVSTSYLILPLYNMYVYVNLFEIKNLACACVNLLSLHFLYVEFEVIW